MAGRKNGLGRGLDAFFPDRASVVKEPARKTTTKTVKTEKKSDVAEKQTNPTVAKKQTADSSDWHFGIYPLCEQDVNRENGDCLRSIGDYRYG